MDETAEPGPPHVRPEDMRAGDADRDLVLARLRAAHTEGRLDAGELAERITATLAARTYGDLAALVDDLPGGPPQPRPLGVPVQRSRPVPTGASAAARENGEPRPGAVPWVWVSVMTIAVWTAGCVATGQVLFPWWIFVVGPWGLGLLWTWSQHQRRGD